MFTHFRIFFYTVFLQSIKETSLSSSMPNLLKLFKPLIQSKKIINEIKPPVSANSDHKIIFSCILLILLASRFLGILLNLAITGAAIASLYFYIAGDNSKMKFENKN